VKQPVSKHVKHVPKHRLPVESTLARAPRKALRTTLVLSSAAVVATGLAVSTGLATQPSAVTAGANPANPANAANEANDAAEFRQPTDDVVTSATPERDPVVSRSDRRDAADPLKKAVLSQVDGPAMTQTEDLSDDDPREIGRVLLVEFGFSSDQYGCLDSLYTRESNWTYNADNPTSSAYGIPQALPGSKMSTAGADWATNPVTQIRWGLGYIRDRYGSPCGAWAHSQSVGWY